MAADTMAAAGSDALSFAVRAAARYLDRMNAIQERLVAASSSRGRLHDKATAGQTERSSLSSEIVARRQAAAQISAAKSILVTERSTATLAAHLPGLSAFPRLRRPRIQARSASALQRTHARSVERREAASAAFPIGPPTTAAQAFVRPAPRSVAPNEDAAIDWERERPTLGRFGLFGEPQSDYDEDQDRTDSGSRGRQDLTKLSPEEVQELLIARGGPGTILEHEVRTRLQPHLKFDPSLARMHTGPVAAESARTLRAEAFTIGRNVFFGESRFAPNARAGIGLLAHELTHVGQQAAGLAPRMRFFTASGGDAQEQEAQKTASDATQGAGGPQRLGATDNKPENSRMQDSSPPHASMGFSLVQPRTNQETSPPSTEGATTEPGAEETPSAGGADARGLADRVYELMMKEIKIARLRGQPVGKG